MRTDIITQYRSYRTVCGLVVLFLLAALPLDTHVSVPAVYSYGGDIPVTAPEAAIIHKVLVDDGATVSAGDTLFELRSPELEEALTRSQLRIELLQARLDRAISDRIDLSQLPVLEQELSSETERFLGLNKRKTSLLVTAPISGQVRDLNPNLRPEQWLNPTVQLARIISPVFADVRGYVKARDLARLHLGASARFVSDNPASPSLKLTLSAIAPTAIERIDLAVLTSTNGGDINVDTDNQGILRPRKPVYLLRLEPTKPPLEDHTRTTIGTVEIEAKRTSFADVMVRQVAQVLSIELSL